MPMKIYIFKKWLDIIQIRAKQYFNFLKYQMTIISVENTAIYKKLSFSFFWVFKSCPVRSTLYIEELSCMIISIIKEILFVASFWILFLSVIIYLFRNKSKVLFRLYSEWLAKGSLEVIFFPVCHFLRFLIH